MRNDNRLFEIKLMKFVDKSLLINELHKFDFKESIIIPHITELGQFPLTLEQFKAAIGQEAENTLDFNVFIETHDLELIKAVSETDDCGMIQCRLMDKGLVTRDYVNVCDSVEMDYWLKQYEDFR